jgi:tRNA(Ile)-lysidine synthase TilS/MesJ
MPDPKPTVQEVMADANDSRQKLATLEHQLQDEIDAIDFQAFQEDRALTPDEAAQRKSRRATQAEVREGFRVLAFVTAQRLDDAAETGQLLRQIQNVNVGLGDDLKSLAAIRKYATIAAQVADALAKAAEQLAAIAA